MLADYTIDGFENIKYQGFERLRRTEKTFLKLFKSYGYAQVETPTFEAYDLYAAEPSVDADELFKLINASGKVLALKPDATLPVTRMAAINHHDPDEIIKFCYLTNIYQDFSAPLDSRKETTQTGIEYFGNADASCEGEVIALAITALKACGIEHVHIDVGHVGFINGLLDAAALPPEERAQLFKYIENKNIGDIHRFLDERPDIPEDYKGVLLAVPRLYGAPAEIFSKMRALALNPEMEAACARLEAIEHYLSGLGLSECLHIDIGFTSRMNYYSGMVFKGYIEDCGEPVINGGRYDTLSSRFGIARPACGFSVSLIDLMDYLNANGLSHGETRRRHVLLYEPGLQREALAWCAPLRVRGRAEMFELDREPEAYVKKLLKNTAYHGADISLLSAAGLFAWDGAGFTEVA